MLTLPSLFGVLGSLSVRGTSGERAGERDSLVRLGRSSAAPLPDPPQPNRSPQRSALQSQRKPYACCSSTWPPTVAPESSTPIIPAKQHFPESNTNHKPVK